MIIYVIAISLQLTGAIYLISNFIPSKDGIVKTLKDEEPVFHWRKFGIGDVETSVTYSPEELNAQAEKVYRNVFALISTIAGYLLGVFGDIGDGNRWIALIGIVLMTAGLFFGSRVVIHKVTMNKFKEERTLRG